MLELGSGAVGAAKSRIRLKIRRERQDRSQGTRDRRSNPGHKVLGIYDHSTLQQLIGAPTAQYRHWVKILGSEAHMRPLSRAEAIAIAAVEHMRSSGVQRKKLERTFASLAFQPPAGTHWLLVSEPRKGVQIVQAPLSRDLRWRSRFGGRIFDPATFLRELDA